jgi:hypothetical protein
VWREVVESVGSIWERFPTPRVEQSGGTSEGRGEEWYKSANKAEGQESDELKEMESE